MGEIIQELQFGSDYERPLVLSSSCYVSPPNSSPYKKNARTESPGQRTRCKRDRVDINMPSSVKSFPPTKAKRRRVYHVDATFTQLDDDKLDEDYVPTQIQNMMTPPTSSRRARKAGKPKKRLVSPEIGDNRMITDYFMRVETPLKKEKALSTKEDEPTVVMCVPTVKNEPPKTPTKTRQKANCGESPFKTPKSKIKDFIPSTTPGLSPLSKSLAWRFETSPTPKAELRKAQALAMTPMRRKRRHFVVPSSQWDDAEHEELEALDNDTDGFVNPDFRKSVSESLASNDEDEWLDSGQHSLSPRRPIFLEPTLSSRESTPSQIVHCGQQTKPGSLNHRVLSFREDDDVWTAQREELSYLMDSSSEEIEDEDSQTKLVLPESWNSPKSSPLGKVASRQTASRIVSKTDSFISDADSESKIFFPATQRRPSESAASLSNSHETLSTDEDEEEYEEEGEETDAYESCDDGQITQTQNNQVILLDSAISATSHQTPTQTQGSAAPSTQFYLDKILTESMLESLPLPDFSTQLSNKSSHRHQQAVGSARKPPPFYSSIEERQNSVIEDP